MKPTVSAGNLESKSICAACLLCILIAWFAFGQQTATIEGTVVNAITSTPISKAHVTLEPAEEPHDFALIATTSDAGQFRFADVKPGRYSLIAGKEGFISASYGEKAPNDRGTLLKINGNEHLTHVTLRLLAGGVVSGHVLDADGDPLPGAHVLLLNTLHSFGRTYHGRGGDTTTDRDGSYRIDEVLPGTYFACVPAEDWGYSPRQLPVDSSGKVTRMRDLSTCFPATTSLSDAQPIRVESGQEQSGIDIAVQRGPMLRIKGRIAADSTALAKYTLSASIGDDIGGFTGESGKILPNGDFLFDGLPPGNHELTLTEQGPNGPQTVGKTEVTLTDQDVSGVVITLIKPAQVRVRVVVESEEDSPLTRGAVFLTAEQDGTTNSLLEDRARNGTFLFPSVWPGKYQIRFNGADDCCYLKSVQSGGRMLTPNSIDVTEGATLDLILIYSKNGASVNGTVQLPPDQPEAFAQVVLISEDEDQPSYARQHWPPLDQTHHFSIDHLPPGKYLAFAAQDEDWDLWSNADFIKLLQPQAKEIELHEKETLTIDLQLISRP